MGERDQLDIEGADIAAARHRDDRDRRLRSKPDLGQLAAQDRGGEGCCVKRTAEARPQIGDRADMIFMGMGEDDADQIGTPVR